MPRYRPSRKRQPQIDEFVYESDLQATIRRAASLLGYLEYHTHDSRRSPEGFPDLVIAGHGHLFAWELKSSDGNVTDTQQRWLDELQLVQSKPDVRVIRPGDLDFALNLLQKKVNASSPIVPRRRT